MIPHCNLQTGSRNLSFDFLTYPYNITGTFLEAEMPPSPFPLLGDSSLRGGGGVFLADFELDVTESKSGRKGGLNKSDEA